MWKIVLPAVLAVSSVSVAAKTAETMSPAMLTAEVDKAAEVLFKHKPNEAIALVDPVITEFDRKYKKSEKTIFCTENPSQTLEVLAIAALENKNAIAIGRAWCSALFIKGFALIDVKRRPEAGPYLKKASEMAPLNAHYANEYAEWHKGNRNWQKSYDIFEHATELAHYTHKSVRNDQHARSLRGMGFTMIELGKLDEAEKLFNQSLELTPGNKKALGELQYIKSLRARAKTQ